jgi:hypothetical protein
MLWRERREPVARFNWPLIGALAYLVGFWVTLWVWLVHR